MSDVRLGRPLAAFVVTLVAVLGALAGLCFVVNPLGYYAPRIFPQVTWSSRRAKIDLMRAFPSASAVILGSSRSMKLDPARLAARSGVTAFNAAVDSARAEDLLAVYRFVVEDRAWPVREIILGVDVEAFHDHVEPDLRLLGTPELLRALPWSMRMQARLLGLARLISFDQATVALRALARRGDPPSPIATFSADGLMRYTVWDAALEAGRFVPDLDASLAEYDARFAGFDRLSTQRVALLGELLDDAARRGIRVRAFVTPLGEGLRAQLIAHRGFTRLHGELLAILDGLRARHPRLTVLDATDVRTYGGDPRLFYDGAHIRPENAARLIDALYADALQ